MSCNICDPKNKYNDCICGESFLNFEEKEKYIKDIKPDFINIAKMWGISTMTICCKFNSNIDIEKYKSNYNTIDNNKSFYNCINIYLSCKYQSKNKISMKIFKNGNIQMAGLLNEKSSMYSIRKIFKRLNKINAFIQKGPYISNVRICMINSDFKIDNFIKQKMLCEKIEEENYDFIKRFSFNPSKYPGINLKLLTPGGDTLSCILFRPGSIIITGGKNLDSYRFCLEKILNILENNIEILY
tara:strand:- start:436 stop:1161 length:726 start_codon:yes stop_codon:yes gene_type:complete